MIEDIRCAPRKYPRSFCYPCSVGSRVEVKDAVVYACIEQLDEKLICATALWHRNKPII